MEEEMQELEQSGETMVQDFLEDSELIALVNERLKNPEPSFEVNLDDL